MRFGSESAQELSGRGGGHGSRASLEGRSFEPSAALLGLRALCPALSRGRLDAQLPTSVLPSGAEPLGALVGQVAGGRSHPSSFPGSRGHVGDSAGQTHALIGGDTVCMKLYMKIYNEPPCIGPDSGVPIG